MNRIPTRFYQWLSTFLLYLTGLCCLCFADTTAYVLGNIPPLEVRKGGSLQFQLQSPQPGAATFAFAFASDSRTPLGALSLDPASGIFTYKPADGEEIGFRLVFTSQVAGMPPISQTVSISLPSEKDFISSARALPDPASTDYLLVSQSQNGQESFNGIVRNTWNAEISGKTVIFDSSSSDHGNLYTRFNNRPDLKNLVVYAETLIVRSPLKLPGTNVVVFARHLRFEDVAGQASLDTTPLGISARATQFQNGSQGQNGGDITLHIQDFFSQPGPTIRLIARGGAGQDAGEGRPGGRKPDLIPSAPNAGNWGPGPWNMRWGAGVGRVVLDWPFQNQTWGWVLDQNGEPFPQNATPYPSVIYVRCDPCGQYVGGQQRWPEDGEDALPPGVPGTGGNGGTISSSLPDLGTFIDVSGGTSGQPGSPQPGGPAQNPVYSAQLRTIDGTRCNDDFFNFAIIDTHRSNPGRNASSISAAQPQGSNGSFSVVADLSSLSWMHPYFLRMVIAHAKDAYMTDNLADTQRILADYSRLLGLFPSFPDNFALDFQQMQSEMKEMLHRLANNMDYFGHTRGWVPLLSLQATMAAFSNEVDAAVPLLFLSEWLKDRANQNLKDITALQDTMSQLSNEATSAAGDIDAAQQNLPELQNQAAQINAQLQTIETLVQARETLLLQEAEHNVEEQRNVPFWKKALRVIGTVAEAVPAFQPALSSIGAGLNFVANFDNSQPLQSLQNVPDITNLFEGKTWTDSETNYNNFIKSVDFRSFSSATSFAKELNTAYQAHQKLIDQTVQQLQTSQISDSEVQKEFDQLKAQDSRFNDLIQQVSDLQSQKQQFAQSVANALQQIASRQATINKDLLSVGSLFQNLNATAAQFDHGMLGYVVDMEQRSRERLLRYQYYMARAYEYYMLQPYPGDLNVDSVVNKILAAMNTDGYQTLLDPAKLDAIKAVYFDSVRQIVSKALTQLESQPPERSLPFFFSLTNDQLKQLNDTGRLNLDLAPLIAGLPNEDNRHIADLTVSNITVQTTGPLGQAARLRLIINHQGQSTEVLSGHQFGFDFGNGPNDQPFTWGASYNLPGGPLSQESLSVSGLSLLQAFLKISGPTDPLMTPLALFARPGADATISLLLARDPADVNAQITSLQMSATVDFFRTTSNQVRLSVRTENGILPYIKVDHADVANRSDGLGTFLRTYQIGDTVTLAADSNYGAMSFVEWDDDAGRLLSASPTLTLKLANSMNVRPVYTGTTSGNITDPSGAGIQDAIVTLTGTQSGSIQTDRNGAYHFGNLPAGSYTLTPFKSGLTFVPPSVTFVNIDSNQLINFTAQTACSYAIDPSSQSFGSAGGTGSVNVTTQNGCNWSAASSDPAVTISSGASGTGNGIVNYLVQANNTSSERALTLTIAGQKFTVTEGGISEFALSVVKQGTGAGTVTSNDGSIHCDPTCSANVPAGTNITLTPMPASGSTFIGWGGACSGSETCTVTMNMAQTVFANFQGSQTSGLRFVPVDPCRIADTRNPDGPFGGPFLKGETSREFAIPNSSCAIPPTAQAYSVNVTVVPKGPLGFLTMFPCGQPLPLTSTLNSTDGRTKAVAAIVPAGANGSVCAFSTNETDMVLDINGYFVAATTPSALSFYPVTPCRLVDTRLATAPLGGPSLAGSSERTFPVLSSPCNVPSTAKAYSLNFTAVPKGNLGFLTTWPAGQSQPLVSTLNAGIGIITANAAIVPAGSNGDISVFVTNESDLVIDINGYFAAPGPGGLSLFNLTPCRVLDTRNPSGARPFAGTLGVNVGTSGCGAPASAKSFVLNATVVPLGPLGYLTMWPQGTSQPFVSTLNAVDGSITSNMAIVPATNGSINVFALDLTHLVLDVSGYFAP
jgi:hypothetical protein